MKLRKFESLAKHSGRVVVVNIEKEHLQYISNGYVAYPMHKLPKLSREMIFALLNIDEAKQDTFAVEYGDNFSFDWSDSCENEEPMKSANFSISLNERNVAVIPVFTKSGLYYYMSSWIAPFIDENYTLAVRYRDDNTPYIAIKSGMLVLGFVMLQNLNELINKCKKGKEDLLTMYSMIEVEIND